jgi:type I restriction enzyme, R subunit
MPSQTKEAHFEAYVEQTLLAHGWGTLDVSAYDQERALFPAEALRFIQATQETLWRQMQALHGDQLGGKLIDALCKELDLKGTLTVLRHGFKFHGKTFRMAHFKPAHGLNPEVTRLYARNVLSVSRQVPCHPGANDTVDIVLSCNGLPVTTCELKNPMTGQTWRNALLQYKNDRDPRAPLFSFRKRALVHFAVDPEEAWMTTRLSGDKTSFLPFNRGDKPGDIACGAGNPPHSSGHRTGYLFEDVLARDSFLDILGSFMFLEKEEKRVSDGEGGRKTITVEKLIFPRFHQLDAVRKLIASASVDGVGNHYLVQHSAGSGKTNSISWLSHRLASLHDDNDAKVFDCVLVITDRRVLDQQLQDAIYQIEHKQGVVQPIDQSSQQLAAALVDGTAIVITTLQKFPFVLRGLLHQAGAEDLENPDGDAKAQAKEWQESIGKRRYAIIIDEAHSSQTGETARELKAILGAGMKDALPKDEDAEDNGNGDDFEDTLNKIMESRGRQKNLSLFAFTATPKGKTIELFGRKGASGMPEAFHTYSMSQAIQEGFILDVLRHYTTYKTYFKLVKAIEDDPKYPKKKAARALAKFMSLHPHNIEQKTEVMVEHFRRHVKHRVGGRAKAMVVSSSRLSAVRYMRAFQRYIAANGYTDIRPLVAFSGTVKDPVTGEEFSEPGMNVDVVTGKNIGEQQLPARFDSDDYNILLVANKYQTGFDQPLLHTMYVDKRLSGVQAVQTLSRLNRRAGGKDSPFILDFVNDTDEIYRSFKPYYDTTSLFEESDPQQLESLKHELDQEQVYHWSEVKAFAKVFYKPQARQHASDHARMHQHLAPAKDRFKAMEEDAQDLFRDKLGGYVRLYGFLSQIMPYVDPELEMLYSFGRLLLPLLPAEKGVQVVKPEDKVDLEYYRLQRIFSGAINLGDDDPEGVKSPTDVGTGKAKDEEAPLSNIIEVLNDRFHTEFTEEDRLFFEQIKVAAVKDNAVIQTASANPLDKFQLGVKKRIESIMIQRMADNDKIVSRYMDDPEFQQLAFEKLSEDIFKEINAPALVR